ncbi:MAG: DUF5671 domain-containing protein [Candidatus Paceibacterota bacterium]|jgi:hypothetical protein
MNTKTSPKDFFLYVAATVAMYIAVVSLINLLFSIINYSFPDVLAYSYSSRSMAWPMSMVVVLVPVFYILEWMIGKDVRMIPEKAGLWIRRWRTYLTLFLTGATIIGDVIALINIYLSGEITTRFIWKVLAVLVIAGTVFVYYLLDKQEIATMKQGTRKALAWAGIVIVLASIIGGFIIVGTPGTQRLIRLDQQRINDLQNIQWQIVSYWQNKGSLPTTLSDLTDTLSYSKIPMDPLSSDPYEYAKSADKSFSICATFGRANEDTKGRGPTDYNGMGMSVPYSTYDSMMPGGEIDVWNHPAGKHCYSRTIDEDRYPINKPSTSNNK